MQNNKYLSQESTQALIDELKVKQADGQAFLQGLADKGYTIQGFNDQPKPAEKTLSSNIKQRGSDLVSAVSNVGTNMSQAQSLPQVGKTIGRGVLRAGGAVAGAAMDTLGAATGAVDDILGNIPSNAIKTGGEAFLATETGKKALSNIQQGATSYEEFKKTNPEGAKDLENAIDIASILPAIKGVKTLSSGVIDTAKLASNITSKTVAPIGEAIKKTGEKLYSTAFTPNVREAEQLLAYEASRPANFIEKIYGSNALQGNAVFKPITQSNSALRSGLAGTEKQVGVQAKRAADSLYNKEIAPAVKSIQGVITKDDLFNPLQENINNITDPSKKKAYQNALEALKEDYVSIDKFTFQEAQKLKSEIAEFTPAKVFRGQDVANETRMLQADIAGIIRNKTYDALKDVNIKQKYMDYGNLKELEKVGVKAISEQKLKGGFGGFWSQIYDTAMTPFKTIGGKVIYKIGDKLQIEAPKGFEGKPLRNYLESVGYLAPVTAQEETNN
jgi:hypothetical protein